MRRLLVIFLVLTLALSLVPVVATSAPAEADFPPTITWYPINDYLNEAALIGGMVSDFPENDQIDPADPMDVQITWLTDPAQRQWNGGAWADQPQWAEPDPVDFIWDTATEAWLLDTTSLPMWTDGGIYELTAIKARDVNADVATVFPGEIFVFDITPPDVGIDAPSTFDDLDEIEGSSWDVTSPVVLVKVRIQRLSDDYYLNLDGHVWQECETWNDAEAADGVFNEINEDWILDTSGVAWYDGVTYEINAMASDAAGNVGLVAAMEQFVCNRDFGGELAIDVNGEGVPYYLYNATAFIRGSSGANVGQEHTVQNVQVRIRRDTPPVKYWNGTAWIDTALYLNANALNPPFDTSNEDWNYITIPGWVEGNTYTVNGKVFDEEVPSPHEAMDSEQFTIDLTNPDVGVDPIPDGITAPFDIEGSASDLGATPGEIVSVMVQVRKGVPAWYEYWNGIVWQNVETWLYATDIGTPDFDEWILGNAPGVEDWQPMLPYTVTAIAVDGAGWCSAPVVEDFTCGAVVPPPPVYPTPTPTATATTPPVTHPTPTPTASAVPSVPTPSPTPTASATPTPYVEVDAPATVGEGESFTAIIRIHDVKDFDHATYDIIYDADLFELTGVTAGQMGATAVPLVGWDLIGGMQGKVRIANEVPGTPGLDGSGTLSRLAFDVVGLPGNTSDIAFVTGYCVLYDNGAPNASVIPSGWVSDSVQVVGPTPTPTPSSTVTATPTATAGEEEESGTPGWLWPLIGIMIVLTLIFIGLALYKGGVIAKLAATWGASEEDFIIDDDMSDEDLYDAMYGGPEEEEL